MNVIVALVASAFIASAVGEWVHQYGAIHPIATHGSKTGRLSTDAQATTNNPCHAYDTTQDCSGHGRRATDGSPCECDREYDAVHNKTTVYSGDCCQAWKSSWYTEWSDEWQTSNKEVTAQASRTDHGVMWTHEDYWANWTRWTNGSSWQDAYCWCDADPQDNGKTLDGSCSVQCWANETCNNNGACDEYGVCQCYDHFRGEFCDECELGWGGVQCDQCAQDWYPAGVCNVYCTDNNATYGCNGLGTCNEMGTCTCQEGYTGSYCQRCQAPEYIHGVWPSCVFCTAEKTCNGNGECDTLGHCLCKPQYGGADCTQCVKEGETFPDCSLPDTASTTTTTSKGGAGEADTCPGPNLALPIILSILLTLLVLGGAFAAYKVFQGKKAGGGGGKGSNWNEFDDGKGNTAYSQL